MQPFRVHSGLVAALPRNDVDTDQIIPKQFLKRVERSGFGQFLFHDWRSDPSFSLTPGASILVTGRNFGCGSSREHAAWALLDAGFRAIIAPSFADIFAANCTSNGIATIAFPLEDLAGRRELTIDLERCEIRGIGAFRMEEFQRQRLLNGHDEIALTLLHEERIAAFERRRGWMAWT
ncbi:MAG: 3-isopropylmalate dehydratase small subunit [Chloroflexota bacterium]